jgi:PAS domain S-box-containing protein
MPAEKKNSEKKAKPETGKKNGKNRQKNKPDSPAKKTQPELEESRRKYIDLYDYAPLGYFTIDTNGIITTVNLTGSAMLNRERQELLHKPFTLFVHPEDKDLFYLCLRKTIKNQDRQFCHLRLQPPKSPHLHAHLETMAVVDAAGNITAIKVTVTDMTDRVRAEQQLQEKTSVISAIINHTDFMLAYLDLDFNFIWVNPAYAETCRMKPEMMIGKNHFKLFPHAENETIFKKVRDTGKNIFFKDKPFVFSDQPKRGVTYWDWSLVPVTDSAGQVNSLVFSLRETTRSKKMELELAESEARFRNIADTSIDIIFQIDRKRRITYVSPACRSLGYSPDYVEGRDITQFIVAEDMPRAEAALKDLFSGRNVTLFELRLIRSDGSMVECEINANSIAWMGMVTGIQGIARDISGRKLADEKIRKLARFPADNPYPVMRSSSEGILLYANKASTPLLEYLGAASGELLPAEFRRLVTDVFLSGINRQIEFAYNEKILSLNLVPIGEGDFVNIYGFEITERKLAEEKIMHHNDTLNAINAIFQAGLQSRNGEELAGRTLEVAKQITGSSFGFIGEVGPDGLLHDIAMIEPDREQPGLPDKTGPGKTGGSFRLDALYTRILADNKPLLTNNPSEYSGGEAAPPAQLLFSAFIGVPLLQDNRCIGLLALAKQEGSFQEDDLELIQQLTPVFAETLFKFRAENALLASESRERTKTSQLQQLLDFTPIPVWIAHDRECREITGNIAAAQLLEIEPEMNVSQTPATGDLGLVVKHLRKGREMQPDELPLQQAVRHGKPIEEIEVELVLPGGKHVTMLGAARPMFDATGEITGGIAAYIDITERKKFEDDLLRAKQDWERTFESVPDLVAILDRDHTIQRVNRAMAKRVGLPPDRIIGSKCYSCLCGISEPLEDCPHTRTLVDGKEHRKEFKEKMLGGYFLVTTTPLYDEEGNLTRSIYVARDITEQKRTEKIINNLNRELHRSLIQLENVNENLTRSNEDLLHFASIVSHDLQEPLRTVASFVQLIRRRYEPKLDQKGLVFMDHILSGTNYMQRLLNDLLAFSRVGGGELVLKPVDLEDVLRETLGKLNKKIRETRAEVTSGTLPVVYGDDLQLSALLQNLLTNALKYRSEDPPQIYVSAQHRENEWMICVQDNGIGIDPKHADHIFLIFQRLHLRDEYEGTGIGLAICKKIVERHGGRIWVESVPGQGATFCFSLPEPEESDHG